MKIIRNFVIHDRKIYIRNYLRAPTGASAKIFARFYTRKFFGLQFIIYLIFAFMKRIL